MTRLVYLAGPMAGLSYEDALAWRREAACLLRPWSIQCISPLRGEDALRNLDVIRPHAEKGSLFSTNKAIVARDLHDIRRSDALLVNMSQATKMEPSIGTIIEIAWGHLLSKPIVLIPDAHGICEHAMLDEITPFRAQSLTDAVNIMLMLLTLND